MDESTLDYIFHEFQDHFDSDNKLDAFNMFCIEFYELLTDYGIDVTGKFYDEVRGNL